MTDFNLDAEVVVLSAPEFFDGLKFNRPISPAEFVNLFEMHKDYDRLIYTFRRVGP